MNALQAARRVFIQSESSNKLKTALQRKTRDVTTKVFNIGDHVYYKRPDHKEWRVPGVILGLDGSHVLVRHGGSYVRVSPCHLRKVHDDKICSKNIDPNTTASVTSKPPESSGYDILMTVNPFELNSASLLEHPDTLLNDEQCDTEDVDSAASVDSLMHPEIISMSHEPVEEEFQGAVIYEHNANDSADNVDCSESDAMYGTNNPATLDKDVDTLQTDETETPSRLEVESFSKMPKIRDRIQFIDPDTNELNEYLVVSRAGKASGIYRHWLNVKNMKNGRMQSVDFDKISQWTPVHEEVMYSAENSQEVFQAQNDELDKWKEYQVYEEVEDAVQDAITTKWVVIKKKQNGNSRIKARLVARGFEKNTTKIRTYSPTISKENLRLICICMTAVNNGWKLHGIDVKAAFLEGFPIDRDVYLVPPVEANTGNLWKLKTAVYGLVDASRAWYLTVTDELTSQGAKCSIYDNALFYRRNCGKLEGIVCCHVDDFLFSGGQLFHDKVIRHLRNQFSLSNESDSSMIYIGIEMLQSDHEIIMHETNYINSIKPLNIENISPNRKLVLSEVCNLKALIGQLQWAAKLTRPDIAFAACDLSTRVKQATTADVRLANKQLRKLQDQCSKICIPDIGNICHASLIVFSDASHANLQHGESQGGFIVFLQVKMVNHLR